MLTVEKHSIKHSLNQMLLVVLITLLQCFVGGCDFETSTKVEIATDSLPPVFSFKGSGNMSRFIIYGPLVGEYANEEDRPVLWMIFPDRNSISKPIYDLPPIKYGEVPDGWTQHTPKNVPPSPLTEGAIYRVVANVNSANSGYLDIIARNGKVLLVR